MVVGRNELIETIQKICQPGKGILAADESSGTIGKRFSDINLSNTRENRREYRDILFTTPNLNRHISGVITYEETLFDTAPNGKSLIQPLLDNNIVVGIKVDMGVKPLYGTHGESVTQGIDNLDARCQKYYEAGARFAKWRAVLKIDSAHNCPSDLSIHENASTLARYASICINNGLVPIVEPEILMDGTHTIEESCNVAINVLNAVYRELVRHNVAIECTLLKPNMVRTGVSSGQQTTYDDIAEHTIHAFQEAVPVSMPGVVFLSGGMTEIEASSALNAINKYKAVKPWRLTFSYGRALQASVLKAWNGKSENRTKAQEMLMVRARANGMASNGTYEQETGNEESLHEENYVY